MAEPELQELLEFGKRAVEAALVKGADEAEAYLNTFYNSRWPVNVKFSPAG